MELYDEIKPLNDERFTRDNLSKLLCDHDTHEYSYLAVELIYMISNVVLPESNDERTLFGYIANYLRLRKSWEYMEKSDEDEYKKIQPGAVTETINHLLEFCDKWNIHAAADEDNNWMVSNIRPKDY